MRQLHGSIYKPLALCLQRGLRDRPRYAREKVDAVVRPACTANWHSMTLPDTLGRHAYSVAQAAAALGISRRSAFRHVASGALRTTKLGRRRLVPASEIERLTGSAAAAEAIGTSTPSAPGAASSAPKPAYSAAQPARVNLSELLAQVTAGLPRAR